MELSRLIEGAIKNKASDIHLMEMYPPYFRVDGHLIPVKHESVTHEDLEKLIVDIVPERFRDKLERRRGVDVSYQYKDLIRCRVIIFFERHRLRAVFRLIPMEPPTIDELELPQVLKKIADARRGMVIVTGPTGSGKSTTLAAMINHINSAQKISINTIEDPIEYLHKNKKAIVSQREVGDDIENLNIGLIQSLRQEPDIILIGELRDVETTRTAIKAAETGHLVFCTLHTTNAIQTIERMLGIFPQAEHAMVRDQLSGNLKAVLTQNLARRVGGKGRIVAVEIMIVTDMISKLIADNRIPDIFGVMRSGEEGMQTFDQSLAALVNEKKITIEEGTLYCRDEYAYKRYIKGVSSSTDRGGIILGFT